MEPSCGGVIFFIKVDITLLPDSVELLVEGFVDVLLEDVEEVVEIESAITKLLKPS